MTDRPDPTDDDAAAFEHTTLVGEGERLVATWCRPRRPRADAPVFLLSNSGVIGRAGPNRLNVRLARRLAARGIASVRFDLSGLGDSERAPGELDPFEQWILDTRAVMDQAQAEGLGERFAMVGLCSGAEVAYRTALQDPRLAGLVLWDGHAHPTWRSRVRALAFRARRAGLAGLVRKAGGRLVGWLSPAAADAAPAGGGHEVPSRDEYGARLQRLDDRGVRLLVMFCGGEPEWYNYRDQFRDAFRAFPFVRRVELQRLEEADHLLTLPAGRARFLAHVDDWVGRLPGAA